jgi:hypothetical protein
MRFTFNKLRELFGRGNSGKASISHPVGWTSLSGLLEDLDEIAHEHQEIFDTDVRERLWAYLNTRFIRHDFSTDLPEEFGMFSPEGNARIKQAFVRNTKNLDTIIEVFDLATVEQRLTTFTNPKLVSVGGNHLEDYFGSP